MAKKRYSLERGGPRRLEVRWKRGFRDLTISLDGATPPTAIDPLALDTGATVLLPDETSLHVQRVRRAWWSLDVRDELRLERLRAPVPGSDGDPVTIRRRAAGLMALLGALFATFGLLWAIFSPVADRTASHTILVGLLLVVPAAFAASGVRSAILIAAILLVADVLLVLRATGQVAPGAIMIRALIVVHLYRAWSRAGAVPPIVAPA